MSHSPVETLIKMINQIATNNRAYEDKEAAERVASHIKRFWARKMKEDLVEYLDAGGAELDPIAKDAAEQGKSGMQQAAATKQAV